MHCDGNTQQEQIKDIIIIMLKSRCLQVLPQCIFNHLVGSALHQLDHAIFDELVGEMLTRNNVSRPLSFTWVLCHRNNCTRVLVQMAQVEGIQIHA
jgi:hypothetical protein